MSSSLIRLLMVFLVCSTVSIFFMASCSVKKFEKLTQEERVLQTLQKAYKSCINQTGEKGQLKCIQYVETLRNQQSTDKDFHAKARQTNIQTELLDKEKADEDE